MTKEELEKEAEEYANGKGHEHYNYLFEENAGTPATFANWCFKDGAEFGYNKAKEETQAQIEKMKNCGNCAFDGQKNNCTYKYYSRCAYECKNHSLWEVKVNE